MRKQSGLTQEQLAERSGVSVSTIRRLETGRSADHRVGTVNLLADALKAGPDDRRRLAAVLAKQETEPALESISESPPTSSPLPARLSSQFAGAAGELAEEIRSRWQLEEEQRRVHDPYPLPVRWHQAPTDLMDHPENIQRLPPGTAPSPMDLDSDLPHVAEVYGRVPSGRMVFLGRAGSGKSILTIRFVLDLLADPAALKRVPVIFSLGSWDPTATVLHDWLTDRLLRDHPHLVQRVPSGATLAAALLDAGLILPVLDGFDEIAEALRPTALAALNTTSLPLVLTSRRREYAEAVRAAGTPPDLGRRCRTRRSHPRRPHRLPAPHLPARHRPGKQPGPERQRMGPCPGDAAHPGHRGEQEPHQSPEHPPDGRPRADDLQRDIRHRSERTAEHHPLPHRTRP
nr:transcriptional regulator [Streptomyces sp. SID4919]